MDTKILIVEDNPYDEELALHTLKNIRKIKKIEVVRDGKEALDYLLNTENPLPSFVLLDLKLPRVSGLDVLKQVKSREETKTIPVIVFSSSQLDSDRKTCYEFGANSYISKPIEFDQYVQAVSQIGLYWSSYNSPVPTEEII